MGTEVTWRAAQARQDGIKERAFLFEKSGSIGQLISASTLFHVQRDHEQFPREGQVAQFDALGTWEKQLIAYSGLHGETYPSAPTYGRDFMARVSNQPDPANRIPNRQDVPLLTP